MKTKAVRLYGKKDLRIDEFDLSPITEDEIHAKIISDSVCMSTYKEVALGTDHKRVPEDIAQNPIIIGHEFAGEIIEVGKKWQSQFKKGDKFAIQPNINYLNKGYAPGYSFADFGGDATYIKIPGITMEKNCLLKYNGEGFYAASLAEPMSCIIAAFKASYHTKQGIYVYDIGIVENGNMAITAGVGPMGLGTIDYALHGPINPKLLVVTDIDEKRLKRAEKIFTPEDARKKGIELVYINTANESDPVAKMMEFTDGKGYDDVFCMAPVKQVVELSDNILGFDGCLNFFAGPTDTQFKVELNFYNVHYAATHIVGTSGGNTDDMKDALYYSETGKINPAAMVTHIGGLNSVSGTTINLPDISGGKKLIYPHIDMELTAIEDFGKQSDERFLVLADICEAYAGLWNAQAEQYLLTNW